MRKEAVQSEDMAYFRNLYQCIYDASDAARSKDNGPVDCIKFKELGSRLEACLPKLPPIYREELCKPYVNSLEKLGEAGFDQVLLMDPEKTDEACLMLDIAQAILQHGEGYKKIATDALQEIVSDLYDGFLSAEDRHDIKLPDLETIAPIIKWGSPKSGPYTWPADSTANFGVKTAVVNFPPAHAQCGLLAWAALGHETAGHDIIHADIGLSRELKDRLWKAMQEANLAPPFPEYWASRIDETASDVLGILNMGPAAGISLIGYFRGLNFAWIGKPTLRCIGPTDDPHPADMLRGYLAASVVKLLNFSKASLWSAAIEAETDKDLTTILLGEKRIETHDAKLSVDIVASCLVNGKMRSLENHAFGEIQNWSDNDEMIVEHIRSLLKANDPLPELYSKGTYAAHVVAAAVLEALMGNAGIPTIFARMIDVLKVMHDKNPSWGPLYIRNPGDVVPQKAWQFIRRLENLNS